MTMPRLIDRRTFLADLGHGAFALAIVAVAGCSPTVLASFAATPAPGGSTGPTPGGTSAGAPSATNGSATPPGSLGAAGGVSWERVNLGFVSAYLLVRGGEAALVDTGVADSEGAIEASLTGLGLGWSALAHVILTHHHNDHAGSTRAVMSRAPEAAAHAGAEDIGAIGSDRPINAVGDGDRVFDLDIVRTPGHTAGSICVLDSVAGILVAGDALRAEGGRPALPGAQFSVDMDEARRSIVKLGGLSFETLLVGHGDPIAGGASTLVAELGATG